MCRQMAGKMPLDVLKKCLIQVWPAPEFKHSTTVGSGSGLDAIQSARLHAGFSCVDEYGRAPGTAALLGKVVICFLTSALHDDAMLIDILGHML